ncbi:MAG: RND transporter [Deltaproteobacteria bacterium]|nr:RND transporter [Deltaproteobacteria bacterium]
MKTTATQLALFVVVIVGLSACRKDPVQAAGPRTAPAATEHAPAQPEPGSHDDWCDEHQVPESLCTRCNPALAAAFKATNDWCVEHGLPESQCRICNPKLKIERPPKKDGAK